MEVIYSKADILEKRNSLLEKEILKEFANKLKEN